MAKWYEVAILNARKNTKAQEFHNVQKDPLSLAMANPNQDNFVPNLNYFDCSKVSDGASSLALYSEEGLIAAGIKTEEALEIITLGEAVGNITAPPIDPTALTITAMAVEKALKFAEISLEDIGWLEIHIYYNACILSDLLERANRRGDHEQADQISPVSWKHVNFYGQ